MTNSFRLLQPSSLKQKTALFVLLPTLLIMVVIGGISLQLIRQVLLQQWQETAITKLEQAAHYVDMRLMRPKKSFQFLQGKGEKNLQWNEIEIVLDQLRDLEGVVEVYQQWEANVVSKRKEMNSMMTRHFATYRLERINLSQPEFNSQSKSETVSMFAWFVDHNGNNTGHIEVVLSFYDLIDQIVKSPWWKSNLAFIIDQNQNILASTVSKSDLVVDVGNGIYGETDSFEAATWKAAQADDSGTIFSQGNPPEKVSGFYRLKEAPWTLIITAPGEQVLQPILEFRNYFFLIGGIGVVIALSYILVVIGKTTRSINRLSNAADNLANGDFTEPLVVDSRDEVGALTTSFNLMTKQLKERLQLQQDMGVAREVQQNLLPQNGFIAEGLEVACRTLYCDATGGDYIDLLEPSVENRHVTVVVGDVVGHGIGAALLMASLRALIRGRASRSGTLAQITTDVNLLLCKDTIHSGNFATLFYLDVDRGKGKIRWVRCGHEFGLLYSPSTDLFSELRGEGIALGINNEFSYEENSMDLSCEKKLILLASDGVWDAENLLGERFGKERVELLIGKFHDVAAEEIVNKITNEIASFQNGAPQNDDITLVVIKTW